MTKTIKPGTWARILIVAVLVVAAFKIAPMMSKEEVRRFVERAGQMGFAGMALVVGVYVIWCMLGLPSLALTLGAAIVFGFWRGFIVVMVGANLGAAAAFLAMRYVAGNWVKKKILAKPLFGQIDRAVREGGWKIVMLTRLPPISPFTLLNFAYALTSVRFGAFVIGTIVGVLPGVTAYVYLGTLLSQRLLEEKAAAEAAQHNIYLAGFVVTIAVCIYLVRVAKAALARHAIGGES